MNRVFAGSLRLDCTKLHASKAFNNYPSRLQRVWGHVGVAESKTQDETPVEPGCHTVRGRRGQLLSSSPRFTGAPRFLPARWKAFFHSRLALSAGSTETWNESTAGDLKLFTSLLSRVDLEGPKQVRPSSRAPSVLKRNMSGDIDLFSQVVCLLLQTTVWLRFQHMKTLLILIWENTQERK